MQFPFSFWGSDPFAGLTQTLELSENFTGWFTAWTGVVETLELTEDFTGFWDTIWNARTETLELFEDFNAW